MNKIIEQLNLDDDFLFAKVMSDREICKKVLEKILNIKIKHILFVHLIHLIEEDMFTLLKIDVMRSIAYC